MSAWITLTAEIMWRGALVATPPVLLIAMLNRYVARRPATRHGLWVLAMVWFLAAPFLSHASWTLLTWEHLATPFRAERLQSIHAIAALHQNEEVTAAGLPSQRVSRILPTYLPSVLVPTPPRTGVGPAMDSSPLLAQTAYPPPRRRSDSLAIDRWDAAESDTAMQTDRAIIDSQTDPLHRSSPLAITPSTACMAMNRESLSVLACCVWAGGCGLVLFLRVFKSLRFHYQLQSTGPASREWSEEVASCAAEVGLVRKPRVQMVANRISPMVWWMGRRSLILPKALWSELDPVGRRSILYHELAHLRRGDDRLRWLQLVVSILHWWHPLVWWIDGRVRDEAENCCDAWVTWLLPRGRRSYASALLKTSEFINQSPARPSFAGIGVTSVRARRVARRLTMVMTKTQRPRLSLSGSLLVTALAAIAWVATPAWSRPPNHAEPTTPQPAAPELSARVGAGSSVATPGLAELVRSGASLLGGVVNVNDEQQPREPGRLKRKRPSEEEMEARIERLERMIEELVAQRAIPPATVARPAMPRTPARANGLMAVPTPEDGERVVVTYRLSKGKLEALTALMSRNDVPVLIEPQQDGITVHASPAQQEAIEAFIRLIEPEAGGQFTPRIPRTPRVQAGDRAMPRIAPVPPVAPQYRKALRHRQRAELERAIEQISRERDRIESRRNSLREQAENMKDMTDSKNPRKHETLSRELETLDQVAEELDRHMEELELQFEDGEDDGDVPDDVEAPDHAPQAKDDRDDRAAALFARQKWKEAAETYRRILHDRVEDGEAWYQFGYALHMQAQYDEAIAAFQRSTELNARPADSLYNIACGFSLKGDVERALEWLEKAYDAGFHDVDHMRRDSDLKKLRQDPRFEKLLQEWSE